MQPPDHPAEAPRAEAARAEAARAEAARAEARQAWARVASGDPALMLQRASVDAGFRSYWRGATTGSLAGAGSSDVGSTGSGASSAGSRSADATSVIVMDSPPDKEDVRPWLRIRALLERGGVRVPRVFAQDVEAGFLLLEDLGRQTCLQAIDRDNADELMEAAIGQLLRLQAIACPGDVPAYDAALLERELRLFDQWFLGRHLGISLEEGEMRQLEAVYRHLVGAALAQPQVLVHRDYMPRNLMPARDGLAVLDFQDAVRGPIAYDPISLFKDAFLSWPEARVEQWLGRYHARALAAGLPVPPLDRFRHDADLIGVQRHLKVMGIFARLCHRDDKPKYVADVPRFVAYLDAVLPRHPELAPLTDLIARHVRARLPAAADA